MRTPRIISLFTLATALIACQNTPAPVPVTLQLSITTPSADAFTNATQNVQVTVSGGTAQSVVLLKDGKPLATLSAPFSYAWDTTAETEGPHELVARATSGGQDVDSPFRKVTVDRSAPTLSAQTPNPNADNVAVKNPIQVVFSEPVQAGSLNDTSVVLSGAGSVNIAKTLSLGADGRTLSVQPVGTVALPNTLSLSLTAGIKDRAGNALNAKNWSWTLPGWLKFGDDPVTSITISTFLYGSFHALDGADNPVIAANQESSPQGLMRRWTGSTWQSIPSPTEAATDGGSFITALAVDPSGNPIVSWQGRDANNANRDNQYVSRWDGTAWKMIGGALDVASRLFPTVAAIALDAGGNPVVAWAEADSYGYATPNDLYVKRWDGSNWVQLGGHLEVNTNGAVQAIDLELDNNGNPVVAWQEYNADFIAYVKHWSATSASWESLGPTVSTKAGTPSVVVRPNGEVLVAFTQNTGTTSKVELKRWTAFGWEALAEPLLVNAGSFAAEPSLALGTDGNPVVAWAEYATNTSSLYTARLTAQGWTYLGGALTAGANENLANPSLKLDKNNVPTLSYSFFKRLTTGHYLDETRFRRLNQ
jgi:Bacterial Ig-like domain/Bacterial Ig domain